MSTRQPEKLLTVTEASTIYDIEPQTLYALVRDGRLSARRIPTGKGPGRIKFRREVIEEFLRSCDTPVVVVTPGEHDATTNTSTLTGQPIAQPVSQSISRPITQPLPVGRTGSPRHRNHAQRVGAAIDLDPSVRKTLESLERRKKEKPHVD